MPDFQEIEGDAVFCLAHAAKRIGHSPSTLLRAIDRGDLKAERAPDLTWAIRGGDLAEWDRARDGKRRRRRQHIPQALPDGYLSLAEVATMHGVHFTTIQKAAQRGSIPHERRGYRWMIKREDAERWQPDRRKQARAHRRRRRSPEERELAALLPTLSADSLRALLSQAKRLSGPGQRGLH